MIPEMCSGFGYFPSVARPLGSTVTQPPAHNSEIGGRSLFSPEPHKSLSCDIREKRVVRVNALTSEFCVLRIQLAAYAVASKSISD
jgi:hypothetical protein